MEPMSSPFSAASTNGVDASLEGLTPVAEFRSKKHAHAAISHLSTSGVTVRGITLIGEGVRVVEQVMGPVSYGRVALRGAMSGGWMGLFVGLLLTLTRDQQPVSWTGAMFIGVAIGMLVAVVTFAIGNRKQRALSISNQVVPERYVMCCPAEQLHGVRSALTQFSDVPMRLVGSGARAASTGVPSTECTTGDLSTGYSHRSDAAAGSDAAVGSDGAMRVASDVLGQPKVEDSPGSGRQGQSPVAGLTYGEALELKRKEAQRGQGNSND